VTNSHATEETNTLCARVLILLANNPPLTRDELDALCGEVATPATVHETVEHLIATGELEPMQPNLGKLHLTPYGRSEAESLTHAKCGFPAGN
jgi:hypothetical protein